jgi:hypothetical protein
MAKRDRKTDDEPEQCGIARTFCLPEAANEDLAKRFDVSLDTIGNWIAAHPDFKPALREDLDRAEAELPESEREVAAERGASRERPFGRDGPQD